MNRISVLSVALATAILAAPVRSRLGVASRSISQSALRTRSKLIPPRTLDVTSGYFGRGVPASFQDKAIVPRVEKDRFSTFTPSKPQKHLKRIAGLAPPVIFMGMLLLLSKAGPALASSAPAAAAAMTLAQYWRYFFAGGICACLSHSAATPVDVVKTRKQTNPELYNGLSIPDTFRKITREEGPGMLLKGLGPTALGYMIEGALKFGFYELLKPVVFQMTGGQSMLLDFFISGMLAGTIASIALCPIEAARIRLVADPKFAKGMFDALPKMMGENGAVRVLFSGLPAQMAKQVPYTMTKQVSFDFIAAKAYSMVALLGLSAVADPSIKWSITLGSAFIAGILSTFASQPGDMLLSAVNKKGGKDRKSTFTALKEILNSEGVPGLFRGLNARILHTGAIVTLQLSIYDAVKQACGIAATGAA